MNCIIQHLSPLACCFSSDEEETNFDFFYDAFGPVATPKSPPPSQDEHMTLEEFANRHTWDPEELRVSKLSSKDAAAYWAAREEKETSERTSNKDMTLEEFANRHTWDPEELRNRNQATKEWEARQEKEKSKKTSETKTQGKESRPEMLSETQQRHTVTTDKVKTPSSKFGKPRELPRRELTKNDDSIEETDSESSEDDEPVSKKRKKSKSNSSSSSKKKDRKRQSSSETKKPAAKRTKKSKK